MTNRLRQDERDAQPEQQPENQLRRPIVPSWFLDPANDGPREELMVRYRQARNLPEPTQRPIRPPASQHWQPRDWLETQPRPPARSLQNKQSPAPQVSKQPGQRGVRGLTGLFILAAVIAASSGAGFGLVNANFEPLKRNILAFTAAIDTPTPLVERLETPQQLTTATDAVITGKTIATATLDVSNVSGKTNSLIPLALHAEPGLAGQDLLLRISGLPDNAYLTSGQKSNQVWTLDLGDLKNLKLMMPVGSRNEIDIAVAAVERRTGELAAPVKSMTIALSDVVIEPASAPPPSLVQPRLSANPAVGEMSAIPKPASTNIAQSAALQAAAVKVTQGDELLKSGNVAIARKNYDEAWTLGSSDGAYGLARTYDPLVLASLQLGQIEPDSATALQWYERAAAAGKADAISAIVRLRMKPS